MTKGDFHERIIVRAAWDRMDSAEIDLRFVPADDVHFGDEVRLTVRKGLDSTPVDLNREARIRLIELLVRSL